MSHDRPTRTTQIQNKLSVIENSTSKTRHTRAHVLPKLALNRTGIPLYLLEKHCKLEKSFEKHLSLSTYQYHRPPQPVIMPIISSVSSLSNLQLRQKLKLPRAFEESYKTLLIDAKMHLYSQPKRTCSD